jgi:hypothetical protein
MKRILVFGVDPFNPFKSEDINRDVFFNRYGGNTGNLLFGRAVAQYLKRDDNELRYGLYEFLTEEFAERVNDECDSIILPLANHIGHHLTVELAALTRLVKAANVPVTVIGIGARAPYEYSFDFLNGLGRGVKIHGIRGLS